MAIIKSKHAGDYTVMPNDIMRSGMSLEAIGLLAVLLMNRHDWIIYKTTLHVRLKIGREKLDRVFKELQEQGYIISTEVQNKVSGRFEHEHIVYDKPFNGEPKTGFPYTGLPQTAEQPLISNKLDKQKLNKEKQTNIPFGDFWNLYEKKRGNAAKLEAKWNKLKDEERQAIMDYIPKYKQAQPDKQYRKDPATFLNNRAWEDEIIGMGKGIHAPEKKKLYTDEHPEEDKW